MARWSARVRYRRLRPRAPWRIELFAGFGFLTACIALLGPLLMSVTLVVDKASGEAGLFSPLVISPDSARVILGSIAGSLITIASLTASLTIVTLQLLSNQYTPRAVRGFLRRKISQVVSGSFIGIFLYCVLLLVTVREPADYNQPFVPSLGVITAVALALLGLLLLIVFVHRLAETIQVSNITAEIAHSTVQAVNTVHPHRFASVHQDADSADGLPKGTPIHPRHPGYVQRLNLDLLDHEAPEGSRVEILVRVGDFVTTHTAVAACSGGRPVDDRFQEAVRRTVVVGHERDIDQDPAFGIRQLTDIALRAISPAVNDPTTAVTCIGYLRDIIEFLSERALPATHLARTDATVLLRQYTFRAYLEPLTEIARYARTDPRVTKALLEALSAAARTSERVGAVHRHRMLAEFVRDLSGPAMANTATQHDRQLLDTTVPSLDSPASPPGD